MLELGYWNLRAFSERGGGGGKGTNINSWKVHAPIRLLDLRPYSQSFRGVGRGAGDHDNNSQGYCRGGGGTGDD